MFLLPNLWRKFPNKRRRGLAGEKVGNRLCRTKLRLEIFWQENDKAANDRHLAADAEACDDVDRVRHQMPNSRRKVWH